MRVWGAGLSLMNAASTTFGPALPVPATSCADGSFALNDAKLAAEAATSLKQHVRMYVCVCIDELLAFLHVLGKRPASVSWLEESSRRAEPRILR
jgi:hypothetical protein